MKKLIRRIQNFTLKNYLKQFPVVAVVGPRQVGKTTLVRDLLDDRRTFLTFDDPSLLMLARENAMAFLGQDEKITIDEVQKCPVVLSGIKRIVDSRRTYGQFIITGSANISMLPKISETLAGRISFIDMYPLTFFEMVSDIKNTPRLVKMILAKDAMTCWKFLKSCSAKKIDVAKMTFSGGFPPVLSLPDNDSRQAWFKGYVRTYLERDVRELSNVRRLYEYQKFLSLAAFRCAQILNRSDLARDAGIPIATANHFLDLLLATFQIYLLRPYFRNIGKRLIKAPKMLWNDTGLAAYLEGFNTWSDAERLGRGAFLVENRIALEIKTLLSSYLPSAQLFYWRTSGGAEVDFVIESGGRLLPVEVKWKENVGYRDAVSMEVFLKDFKENAPFGIILYRGNQLVKITENIFLVPFGVFLG